MCRKGAISPQKKVRLQVCGQEGGLMPNPLRVEKEEEVMKKSSAMPATRYICLSQSPKLAKQVWQTGWQSLASGASA